MHYKNGREAKNGDKVVLIRQYGAVDPATGKVFSNAAVGILYDAIPGNDHCNGKVAVITANDPMSDLKECLHLDDVLAAVSAAESCQAPPAASESAAAS